MFFSCLCCFITHTSNNSQNPPLTNFSFWLESFRCTHVFSSVILLFYSLKIIWNSLYHVLLEHIKIRRLLVKTNHVCKWLSDVSVEWNCWCISPDSCCDNSCFVWRSFGLWKTPSENVTEQNSLIHLFFITLCKFICQIIVVIIKCPKPNLYFSIVICPSFMSHQWRCYYLCHF